MTTYVGIDLGTTNSAIATFDGENVRLYKNPDQHDVTPSAIFIDRRGNKYIGKRAYDNAARSPENCATLFKRLMGTSTPINLPAAGLVMSPEECSAEILRVLYGFLPEDIRNDAETGTVITVPAAFNQMQKNATMAAAELADTGKVALMQEPVAAVMSVMRHRKGDGVFLVYDLGGGTLDIAIAESISGRVNLLTHGGIPMCGGRDFDRLLLDNVVMPWLHSTFRLPEELSSNPRFATLRHMATWATEKAKIELSSRDEAVIALDDSELRLKDLSGADIYLDVVVSRPQYDALIWPRIEESITAAQETMKKAGLSARDVNRIVFIGGPTQYKPLRERVASGLGIAGSTEVNPMTAVAEGAAVFAESIDWSTQDRRRKGGRGVISAEGGLDLTFAFMARTPDSKAKLVAKVGIAVLTGAAFQVDSPDTGWSSGRIALQDGAVVEVPLPRLGDNVFQIFVFDAAGGPVKLAHNRLKIARTAAQIDAIPASHSLGVEAREKLGGQLVLDYLVREGEQLPKKGKKTFKAEESLRAGAPGSIKFKLWEGEIENPIHDNEFIGLFEIRGSDLSEGVIARGADLVCEYEMLDSGNIVLEVTVPSIGASFHSARNFYSRQEGQIDYTNASKRVAEESERVLERLDEISSHIRDPRLDEARKRLEDASQLTTEEGDPTETKRAMGEVQHAKKLIAQARKEHLGDIRQIELDKVTAFFDDHIREHARPAEEGTFDKLAREAQRAIDLNTGDFESRLYELRFKNFMILWRQDWFVIDRFKWLAAAPHLFPVASEHAELSRLGNQALQAGDIDRLRDVLMQMDSIRIGSTDDDEMLASSNILVG